MAIRTKGTFALLSLLIAAIAAFAFVNIESKGPLNFVGVWQGAIDLTVIKVRLVFDFKREESGSFTGTMDSPDQGSFGFPIEEIEVDGRAIRFTMKRLGATFEGEMSRDGNQIAGMWTQAGQSLAMELRPSTKIGPPNRPQEPKPPYPYNEEEVRYENKVAGINIAGTLTLPRHRGPFPAVLLITGTGPQNRDEGILGHKPFLVWADYLTRRGIAVLRVDDRGIGGTSGKPGEGTIEDYISDALAGVKYLKTRPEIDQRQIGLMGHSEGGVVVSAVAMKSSDVAFLVLLAGMGVNGEQILYSQGKLIAKAEGIPDESIARNLALQKKVFAIAKEHSNPALGREKIARVYAELKSTLTQEELAALEGIEGAQATMALTPWFRHFLTYDPTAVLEKVKCPVLAICGEKDVQVDPKLNLPPIEAALRKASNPDFTIKELPGLNHLLQASESGAISEYVQIEETINPLALKVVGDWLAERTSAK
jgi:uncharacterized protein